MAERFRILQVVDSLEPGGMENVLIQMMAGMDRTRFQFEVCCLSRGGAFVSRLPDDIPVHVLGKPPGFSLKAVGQLRALVRRGNFGIVHTRHLGGLIYAGLACPRRGAPPLVHSEHALWDEADLSRKRQWQRRILYRRASAVFAVSHQQTEQMRKLGNDHPQLSVILNGVDAGRFTPARDKRALRQSLGLEADGLWLGMVARFGRWKRHVDLIEAFELVAQDAPLLRLLLLGDQGPEKARVMARLEASPVRHRIHWAGFQQDPVPWYQVMDVLVVSSSVEGLPNAVLEGMSCGLPLVANDVCGVREIARDALHGSIRDLSTVPLLADALRGAARDSAQVRDEQGRSARVHVQEAFSVQAMIRGYDRLYSSVRR